MERQQSNSLQNFEDTKSEILKKRLLKAPSSSFNTNFTQNDSQHNVLLNTLRTPTSGSMIVSSVQAPQNSMPINNLVTSSIAPVKIHTNNSPYPLQLSSTVHVPVQIPGSTSNINVPVQLSAHTNSVPIHIAPLQSSVTTNVPVQLQAGTTINVPLQLPTTNQNIQLTSALPSMPILQSTAQPLHSTFYVNMGSNTRPPNMDCNSDITVSSSSQLQISDQVKMTIPTSVAQMQLASNPTMVQIPNSSNNAIQLALPNSVAPQTVQLRGTTRTMPHVVYIQTSTGLKPVSSSEVISQASTSGNPPQIIVRRPVTSNSNIHLISNVATKPNIAPKVSGQNKSSILAASQPIVIQKPKEKVIVPVTIASGSQPKQTIAYLGTVKKTNTKNINENQSILISNNQPSLNTNNQKVFLTPMNMNKMQNTKFILPVALPTTMASKGPIINLQIANGQIQNDPQGNITVMRDTPESDMPPLQPLAKVLNVNGADNVANKNEKAYAISITGSRAEPTGEHGEYTLSIPETNASMNDDIYTVSIADGEGSQTHEQSFTLAIPEKGKSLLNRNVMEKHEMMGPVTIAAPAILRRSNSDNSEKKAANMNIKRRISLCNENLSNKNFKQIVTQTKIVLERQEDDPHSENNDDHRVPSLFCDEKLDKDLDAKVSHGDSEPEDFKEAKNNVNADNNNSDFGYYSKIDDFPKGDSMVSKKSDLDSPLEEDPPGLIWSNGIAILQGSNIQFRTNEFGLIDLIDGSDQEDIYINPSVKYHTPLKQRIDRTGREKKPTSPEDLYSCDGCGCHGQAAEFITPNFCSSTCQKEVEKVTQKKKEKERLELMKKRNKMKKLLMKKQHSESDINMEHKEDKVPLKHYDSAPAGSQLYEAAALLKMNEDLVENEKYPWMCGKNGFSWMRYLDVCKAKAAPVKLFKDPFPYTRNGFKVHMRMEAIDPQNPSIFCVVSVAEVQGYRMRLHFDDYPDIYDFWVNADCQDIFPAGWCDKNGRTLQPPATMSAANFSWPLYLKHKRAIAAPKHLFTHITTTMVKPNCFRIGMKLEAEDRKNELVCVASVADMLDNRLRVSFDSWDEMYDYWVEPSSPYIHPVGWAERHGTQLTPPHFYKDPESFSWDSYLSETGASPVPPRAFKTRAPHGFKPGMKLEVVDHRVPFLIRVATISAVKRHQVRVSYDGWPDELSVWLDDDSPDLHPVGWCLKTGHPLEPPLTVEELEVSGACGVGGCRGLGSARGGGLKHHATPSACPYRARAATPPPRRLEPRPADSIKTSKSLTSSTPNPDGPREKLPRGRPPKHKRVEEVTKNDASDDESISSGGGKKWRASPAASRSLRTYSRASARAPRPAPPPAPPRPRLPLAPGLRLHAEPALWSQEQVRALVAGAGGAEAGAAAARVRLGGRELLMASCQELARALDLRLGPAIKVYSMVRQLRDSLA